MIPLERVSPITGPDSPLVTRPNGDRVRFLAEDVRLVERRDGSYIVEADDLLDPLPIPREDIISAAAQVANLVAARLHDARRATRILDDAIHGDDPDAFTRLAERQLDGRGDQ